MEIKPLNKNHVGQCISFHNNYSQGGGDWCWTSPIEGSCQCIQQRMVVYLFKGYLEKDLVSTSISNSWIGLVILTPG